MSKTKVWKLKNLLNNNNKSSDVTIIKPLLSVGRSKQANIQSTSQVVSRQHAELLLLADGSLHVEDLGSSNGTFVNNLRIQSRRRCKLNENDVISFGFCEALNQEENDKKPLDYLCYKVCQTTLETIDITDDVDDPAELSIVINDQDNHKVENEDEDEKEEKEVIISRSPEVDEVGIISESKEVPLVQMQTKNYPGCEVNHPGQEVFNVEDFLDVKSPKLQSHASTSDQEADPVKPDISIVKNSEHFSVNVENDPIIEELDSAILELQGQDGVPEEINTKLLPSLPPASPVETRYYVLDEPANSIENDIIMDHSEEKYSCGENYFIISDNEDDAFLSSQLLNRSMKVEIKEEPQDDIIQQLEELDYAGDLQEPMPECIDVDDYFADEEELLCALATQTSIRSKENKDTECNNISEIRESINGKEESSKKVSQSKIATQTSERYNENMDTECNNTSKRRQSINGEKSSKKVSKSKIATQTSERLNEHMDTGCYDTSTIRESINGKKSSKKFINFQATQTLERCNENMDTECNNISKRRESLNGKESPKKVGKRKTIDPEVNRKKIKLSSSSNQKTITNNVPVLNNVEQFQRSPPMYRRAQNAFYEDSKTLNIYLQDNLFNSDIILCVLKWNTKWLNEQVIHKVMPPVSTYRLEDLPQLPDRFENIQSYKKIVVALALCEMWHSVFTEYGKSRLAVHVAPVHQRVVHNLCYIDCKGIFEKSVVLRENYLVCTEMLLHFPQENENRLQVNFAIITNIKYKTISDGVTGEKRHYSFTLVLKNDKRQLKCNKIVVAVVTNFSYCIGLSKNLMALELSPLKSMILNPCLKDFSVSSFDQSTLEYFSFLNGAQTKAVQEAVNFCMGDKPGLYLIKGPPGTGKSTVILSIIINMLLRYGGNKLRILLTAPSNAAVNNLVSRFSSFRSKLSDTSRKNLKMVRVGMNACSGQGAKPFFLQELCRKALLRECMKINPDAYYQFESTKKLIEELNLELEELPANNPKRTVIYSKIESLRKETNLEYFLMKNMRNYTERMRETEATHLQHCNLLCSTLNSCISWTSGVIKTSSKDGPFNFTCCIVDEATQCTELEALTPLQLGIKKIILVGDPKQLPAVVNSKEAKSKQFGKSLFTRIDNCFDDSQTPVHMLNVQYRMREEICSFPNKRFYNNKLLTKYTVENKITPNISPFLLFNLDIPSSSHQYKNQEEIHFLEKMLEVIISTVNPNCNFSIGIITPYNMQKDAIISRIPRSRLNNVSLTVNTVDSFQGQEKDIIIISFVRYKPNYFLEDYQRINVALTRAKQALFIVGTYDLFTKSQIFYDIKEDAKQRNLRYSIQDPISKFYPHMKDTLFGSNRH